MINKLSKSIAHKLVKVGMLKYEEQELYAYGLFMLFSEFAFLIIVLSFSIILDCVFESMVFYFSFRFLRKYAGGYHAKTEIRCEILSVLSILMCIFIIKLSRTTECCYSIFVLTLFSVICIFAFCPLDTPEKPLSKKEFNYFRKISHIILLVILSLATLSFCFDFGSVFYPLAVSLIHQSTLMIIGKLEKLLVEKRDDRIQKE